MDGFKTTMFKKAALVVLAGATALTLAAGQAEARDGRNAAIIGGAALGLLAGTAIANAGSYDGGAYQQADDRGYGYGYDGGYRDEYVRPRYVYPREYRRPTYVYVEPAPAYGDVYREDRGWRPRHQWHRRPDFHDGWRHDGWGNDGY
jgi:hypothetical protein